MNFVSIQMLPSRQCRLPTWAAGRQACVTGHLSVTAQRPCWRVKVTQGQGGSLHSQLLRLCHRSTNSPGEPLGSLALSLHLGSRKY